MLPILSERSFQLYYTTAAGKYPDGHYSHEANRGNIKEGCCRVIDFKLTFCDNLINKSLSFRIYS